MAQYLYFVARQLSIPVTLDGQAKFCVDHDVCKSSAEFISKVRVLENSSTQTKSSAATLGTDPTTRVFMPSDGLLEIESKARDIASNAINKLRDNNEISNYLCTELSQLYTKEQWICIVGQKPFPSVSVAEH